MNKENQGNVHEAHLTSYVDDLAEQQPEMISVTDLSSPLQRGMEGDLFLKIFSLKTP
jgi:hypothetical protein